MIGYLVKMRYDKFCDFLFKKEAGYLIFLPQKSLWYR